jgi:hypothetical protein
VLVLTVVDWGATGVNTPADGHTYVVCVTKLVMTVPLVEDDTYGQVTVVEALTVVVYPPYVLGPGVSDVVRWATTVMVELR